jgi:hypothetical protein
MSEAKPVHKDQTLEKLLRDVSSMQFFKLAIHVALQVAVFQKLHGHKNRVNCLVPSERPDEAVFVL